jgi:hypothetical protein
VELMLLRLFQRHVAFQCKAIVIAASHIEAVMPARHQSPDSSDILWAAIQNLLTAAANISKACWGQGGKYEAERAPLRESLGIGNDSPLRKVWLRNRFDHFDEALDRWWAESKNHNHLDKGLFSPLQGVTGLEDIEMFRVLDPATGDLMFWGQSFNLGDLVKEADRVLVIAKAEADKPHWTQEDVEARLEERRRTGGGGQ